MGMIKKIKNTIANYILKSELKSLHREIKSTKFNFNEIKTVGILFDASNSEDFDIVKRYVVFLREHLKKVKVIGYFNAKEIPGLTYSKLEYDFFSNKELNWFGKPSAAIFKNFMEEKYDLLIDLNVHDHFSLKYIAAFSKASFKVGKYDENNTAVYDMMIDADNTENIKYFLRQVDTYITMLNKVESNLN